MTANEDTTIGVVAGLREAGWLVVAPSPALKNALAKARADLEWRGPAGRPQNYVVLDRAQGAALIGYVEPQ